jgi:serine/threonine protein kinase
LRSLGLVHNEINPANIMFEGDSTTVIVDFGSCRAIVQSLEGVGRPFEWYDEGVQQSVPINDWDAIHEIREWLSDKDAKNFKFKD